MDSVQSLQMSGTIYERSDMLVVGMLPALTYKLAPLTKTSTNNVVFNRLGQASLIPDSFVTDEYCADTTGYLFACDSISTSKSHPQDEAVPGLQYMCFCLFLRAVVFDPAALHRFHIIPPVISHSDFLILRVPSTSNRRQEAEGHSKNVHRKNYSEHGKSRCLHVDIENQRPTISTSLNI